jgi:signal transduction histidine kinase
VSTDVIDLLPDAVLRLDVARRITQANPAAADLTGHDQGALLGALCDQLLEPRGRDGHPVWADGWHASTRLRSVRTLPEQEVTLRRADGEDIKAYVTGAYERTGDGTLTGAVLVLRESAKRMHHAATGIEIVSTVSHELRSPLSSVKGWTSLLLSKWDRIAEDKKKEMLEQVNHDADRVTRLITELLDISRLETGRLVLRRQMVNLPTLAERVVQKLDFEYPDLDVSVDFPDGFPEVYADPDKVEQVFTNLVENACKYASPKGVVVAGEASDNEVSVSVTDQGEGIPEADLPKVFTKFFRRSEGRPTGSGLGLWISRGLVEAHGGKLTAASIRRQGTTFRFTLPLVDFEELHS